MYFFCSGLSHAFFLLTPNVVAFPSCSTVGYPSVCSGTRVQLWLCRRELLPCHWRPSHWPSSKTLSDLDMRTAQTRALLYCQPPAGKAAVASERTVGCILLLLADQRAMPRRSHILLSIRIRSTASRVTLVAYPVFPVSVCTVASAKHFLPPPSVGEAQDAYELGLCFVPCRVPAICCCCCVCSSPFESLC